MSPLNSLQDLKFSQILDMSQSKGAQAMMLEVQSMITKQFDDQMRDAAEKLEFLQNLTKKYRENINKVYEFQTQNQNTSRKDGKVYYEAGFAEMAELFGAITTYDYNLETKEFTEKPLEFNDSGDKHTVDDEGDVSVTDGKTSTQEWAAHFHRGAQIKDKEEAKEFADQLNGDDGELPFYFGYTNNSDEDGMPKFAFFSDQIDKMLEQMENALSDVEMEADGISLGLNDLSAQRKAALEGLQELVRKIASSHVYALEKGGD